MQEVVMKNKEVYILYVGHSTYIVDTNDGTRLLIDPWLKRHPACPENLQEPKNIDIKRFDEILGKRKRAKSVINSLDYDLRKNISMKEKSALILEITF